MHPCPCLNCSAQIPPDRIMCGRHWFLLPDPMRDDLVKEQKESTQAIEKLEMAIRVVADRERRLATTRSGDWIQTYTGTRFYPMDPLPEEIDIRDIAHALSNLCRFTGHVREFYSVAQHCVLVSQNCNKPNALWGLLHDASEAYIGDLHRPLKKDRSMQAYRWIERRIMLAVCAAFNLRDDEPLSVTQTDQILLTTEARDLMGNLLPGWTHSAENGHPVLAEKIKPVDPLTAKRMFLDRFVELTGNPIPN